MNQKLNLSDLPMKDRLLAVLDFIVLKKVRPTYILLKDTKVKDKWTPSGIIVEWQDSDSICFKFEDHSFKLLDREPFFSMDTNIDPLALEKGFGNTKNLFVYTCLEHNREVRTQLRSFCTDTQPKCCASASRCTPASKIKQVLEIFEKKYNVKVKPPLPTTTRGTVLFTRSDGLEGKTRMENLYIMQKSKTSTTVNLDGLILSSGERRQLRLNLEKDITKHFFTAKYQRLEITNKISCHHIRSIKEHAHLAFCEKNLILIDHLFHEVFHIFNGKQKKCNELDLIRFILAIQNPTIMNDNYNECDLGLDNSSYRQKNPASAFRLVIKMRQLHVYYLEFDHFRTLNRLKNYLENLSAILNELLS